MTHRPDNPITRDRLHFEDLEVGRAYACRSGR